MITKTMVRYITDALDLLPSAIETSSSQTSTDQTECEDCNVC